MSKSTTMVVDCPTCARKVVWSEKSAFRPFCSERCKMIDLGEWAAEEKRIPGDNLPPIANPEDEY